MPEPIVTLNEESLRAGSRELVRKTVKEIPSGLLEEEAGDLVGAERHGRTADREAYRTGHYDRKLTSASGEVTLRMPKLKSVRFTTAAIERLNWKIRGRTRVVGTFPSGNSALILVTARPKCVAESGWGSRRYLDVTLLDE